MEDRDILEKIVEQNGSCEWVNSSGGDNICSKCPMSKLRKKEDGNYYSCLDALNVSQLSTPQETDARYKDAAKRLLLDMSIDDLLRS